MASYHQVTQCIDDSYASKFPLTLFKTETVNSVLQEYVSSISVKKPRTHLEMLLLETVNPIIEAYSNIDVANREAIENLEKIPIYNDWHGNNILSIDKRIIGLIDFDSLTVAPRVVDIQNGLLYAAGTGDGINLSKLEAFIQGYCSILPLSEFELSLTYSVMIDRITFIISEILTEKK